MTEDEKKQYILKNQGDSYLMAMEVVFDNPNIVRDFNGNLFVFNGKYYDLLTDERLTRMYLTFIGKYGITKQWKSGKIGEILKFIKCYDKIPDVNMNGDGNLLCLNNGVLDTETMVLNEHSPTYYFDTYINVDYDPGARECPHFMKYLDDVFSGDQELAGAVIRLGGYLLDYSPENMRKCSRMFLMDGPGGSGKSTLLNVYKMFFSPKQITALSLDDLASSTFKTSLLIESRVNISGEQKRNYIDAENLKLIAEGAEITIEPKFKDAMTFHPKTKIIVACNGLPRFNDTSDGIYRRLFIFPFKNQYKPQEEYDKLKDPEKHRIFVQDRELDKKLRAEKCAILNLFLEGLKMLRDDNFYFRETIMSTMALKEFRSDNDAAREFLEETYEVDDASHTSIVDIYTNFKNWHGLNVGNSSFKFRANELSKRIKEVFKVDANGREIVRDPFGNLSRTTTYPLRRITIEESLLSEMSMDGESETEEGQSTLNIN